MLRIRLDELEVLRQEQEAPSSIEELGEVNRLLEEVQREIAELRVQLVDDDWNCWYALLGDSRYERSRFVRLLDHTGDSRPRHMGGGSHV